MKVVSESGNNCRPFRFPEMTHDVCQNRLCKAGLFILRSGELRHGIYPVNPDSLSSAPRNCDTESILKSRDP